DSPPQPGLEMTSSGTRSGMATLPLGHAGNLESAATVGVLTGAGFLYGAGHLALAQAGRRWPAARTFSVFMGPSILGLALVGPGLVGGEVDSSGFELHALQHLLLGMLAPIFFALSAPVTMLLACLG